MAERAAGRMHAVVMTVGLKGGVQVDRSPKVPPAMARSALGGGAAGSLQMTVHQQLALPQVAPPSPVHVGLHGLGTGTLIDEHLFVGSS
jgi:hypothetical protein